jgi:hypothetical protein
MAARKVTAPVTSSDEVAEPIVEAAVEVAPESPATATKLPRVKACSGLAPFGLGEAGCKRLPRHKGEHRVTLHRPPVVKAAKVGTAKTAKRTVRKVARSGDAGKALRAELAAAVESGAMTPSEALAKFASRIR